ncbi:CHS1 [Mytilus coruscus]|uniref:chitin synthase n=1 Tax=Mytilus coruscus TaxID=42192 RepID=A0A6J8BWH1_MYTCO|nr:CHS1 [Mytilus coruscus]
MYMEYVLNYRSTNFRRSSENLSKIPSYSSLLSIDPIDSSEEINETTQHDLTVIDYICKSLVKHNEIDSVKTDATVVPYVKIFAGDTSSTEKCSVKNGSFNSINTITDSQQIHHEQDEFSCDDYILATDADMTFLDTSILEVLHMCESDPTVGAVCGRTYPKGVQWRPIVWLQMFEYAKDLWIIKSSQNIIGLVMCCPGCFSMYKLEAVKEVVAEYSAPVEDIEDVFTKDNGFQDGHFIQADRLLVMIVLGSYIYGAILYPTDAWILITGAVYLFFIPVMYIILPVYAICNIVDQSWGTRDNVIHTTFLRSLSASSISLSDFNQTEFKFWEGLVSNVIGSSVSKGISNEDRNMGLKLLRKKALIFFLSANLICVIALLGFHAFSEQTSGSKSTFSIVMGVTLWLSPLFKYLVVLCTESMKP